MQLEEMKTLWQEMSVDIQKQKVITDELIIRVTRVNYKHTLQRILIPELIGAMICFGGAMLILMYFKLLHPWYLILCGIISLTILVLLPLLSITAIRDLSSIDIMKNNYKEALLMYSKRKLHFLLVQKLSFYLCAVLFIAILPVMGEVIGHKDLFVESKLWLWYSVLILVLYPFSKWVFRNYKKTMIDAENVLKELGD